MKMQKFHRILSHMKNAWLLYTSFDNPLEEDASCSGSQKDLHVEYVLGKTNKLDEEQQLARMHAIWLQGYRCYVLGDHVMEY